MNIYIGLDIGGTKLMVAAANEKGKIIRECPPAFTPAGLDEGIAQLQAMTDTMRRDDTILGIGASAGGPLDYRTGIVSPLHQPSWRNVPLKDIFETKYGCPFSVDVDTNAAALAEAEACDIVPERLLYITLSTGMGGGFIVDGELYRGSGGAHAEAGHQTIPFICDHPERVQCECGAPDCLEALVSGNAIRRIYGKPAEELDDREWKQVAYNLGLGLRNLAVLYVPTEIAIGGGVAVGGNNKLLPEAERVMRQRLFLTPPPKVRLSRLNYLTALHGAIALARRAGEHVIPRVW